MTNLSNLDKFVTLSEACTHSTKRSRMGLFKQQTKTIKTAQFRQKTLKNTQKPPQNWSEAQVLSGRVYPERSRRERINLIFPKNYSFTHPLIYPYTLRKSSDFRIKLIVLLRKIEIF
jgi:hypothetical protein